jgi:hypothetical protein
VSTLAAASPELRRLWIRVLKRVHPDLAVDEQDRYRCEHLTQQANEAFARGDLAGLRAVLKLNTLPPMEREEFAAPQQDSAAYAMGHAAAAMRSPRSASRGEEAGILLAAGVVLCLLLYGILDALRQEVGRGVSLFVLVLLSVTVLWWIILKSSLPERHRSSWALAAGAGMVLTGISLVSSGARVNPAFHQPATVPHSVAAAITFEERELHAKALSRNAVATVSNAPPKAELSIKPPRAVNESGVSPLESYLDAAKGKVAQNWDASDVVGAPPGATVYIQFIIWPRGNHDVPMTETSSGYPSLDGSCLRAVEKIKNFGHLPRGYEGNNMTVFYHCTYPGPSMGFPKGNSAARRVEPAGHAGAVNN